MANDTVRFKVYSLLSGTRRFKGYERTLSDAKAEVHGMADNLRGNEFVGIVGEVWVENNKTEYPIFSIERTETRRHIAHERDIETRAWVS